MPIQSKGAADSGGRVVLHKRYQQGLVDLDGFSHIYLIYRLHLSNGFDLLVEPFLDTEKHGVFATRAPRRPNPIGLSIVKLLSIQDNIIEITGADMINGTPLLDIKPYMKQFDNIEQSTSGWLDATDDRIRNTRSDSRFITL
ncbi:MAG: tRNA (N6-threonylcarbamoyladenosine(37)-N6)-methyltransferase TrmO [Candidatus Thiodiazotropha endolucinida]|nr:tRNA (N6-threonylcarbamoyladenosine(37)-N6)-methyltransferase TrmO [Candidatus Thiodiazotropha endolucinida]